jgi:membrane protein implicated in regulation of membrane protease activity
VPHISDEHRRSFGYTYVAVFGVGALGSAIAGFILTRTSPALLFVVLAVFAVAAILFGVYLIRRTASTSSSTATS